MWFDKIFKVWRNDHVDALSCPMCNSDDLDFNANVVICNDCLYRGPDHGYDEVTGKTFPEDVCDWRIAIEQWNDLPRSPLDRLRYENSSSTSSKPTSYFK